jgi:hypothetical protein
MRLRNLLTDTEHEATVTANHACASYGQAVVVLENGEAIDPIGWRILEISDDERQRLPWVWNSCSEF